MCDTINRDVVLYIIKFERKIKRMYSNRIRKMRQQQKIYSMLKDFYDEIICKGELLHRTQR